MVKERDLKCLNGELSSWSAFWDSFESSIHLTNEQSSIDKFNYHHSLLAAKAIAGLTLTPDKYDETMWHKGKTWLWHKGGTWL